MYYLKLYELWPFFFRHPVKSIRCVAFKTADWKDDKKLFVFFHRYQHLCLSCCQIQSLRNFTSVDISASVAALTQTWGIIKLMGQYDRSVPVFIVLMSLEWCMQLFTIVRPEARWFLWGGAGCLGWDQAGAMPRSDMCQPRLVLTVQWDDPFSCNLPVPALTD